MVSPAGCRWRPDAIIDAGRGHRKSTAVAAAPQPRWRCRQQRLDLAQSPDRAHAAAPAGGTAGRAASPSRAASSCATAASAVSTPSSPTFCAMRAHAAFEQPRGVAARGTLALALRRSARRARRGTPPARRAKAAVARRGGRSARAAAPAPAACRRRSRPRSTPAPGRCRSVSPLVHSRCRLRLKNVTRPLSSVACSASRSM